MLGAKTGVPQRKYLFKKLTASTTTGKYSDIMEADCKKYGMKPVCDCYSECRNSAKAIYLGQSNGYKISKSNQRGRTSYFPTGWSAIANKWEVGMCVYGRPGSQKASCQVGAETTELSTASENPYFVCARVKDGTCAA